MDTFFALSDANRRQILETLALSGQMSASQICAKFSISQPAVSQHLKVLKASHLVTVKKAAQKRLYSLNSQGINEIEAWANQMKQLMNKRMDNLEKYLDEIQK